MTTSRSQIKRVAVQSGKTLVEVVIDEAIKDFKDYIQMVRESDLGMDTPEWRMAQDLADAIITYERAKEAHQ